MTQTNGKKTLPIQPVEVSLDLDSYTNGELEEIEELVGGNLTELTLGKPPPQKVLNGLLWITMRRTDPEVTIEDARAMKGSAWAFAKLPDPLPSGDERRGQPASPPSAPSTG